MRDASRSADWVTIESALEQILGEMRVTEIEAVALEDAAGRVLGEDARSPLDLPPWDNSGMDGFAVRSADIAGATKERPIPLRLIESVPAGEFAVHSVGAGEAIKIMTGAPVPAGADSVVRAEHAQEEGARVVVMSDADARRNIRPRGEDIRLNDVAVRKGTLLRAGEIGLLASIGCAQVRVQRKPVVAILSTGDELVDVHGFAQVLAGKRIVNSNSYALAAAARAVGAEPLLLGIAPDDRAALREHISQGLEADILVTSAGASVGEHDLVKDVLEELGGTTRFWRVKIRPGSPFSFSRIDAVPVFGLPGNPVSAVVTFEVLVKPALRRMLGRRELYSPVVSAHVAERITAKKGLTQFMRVRLTTAGGHIVAKLTGPQGSGVLSSLARADGLLVLPEDVDVLEAGTEVKVVRLSASDDAQEDLGFQSRMNSD